MWRQTYFNCFTLKLLLVTSYHYKIINDYNLSLYSAHLHFLIKMCLRMSYSKTMLVLLLHKYFYSQVSPDTISTRSWLIFEIVFWFIDFDVILYRPFRRLGVATQQMTSLRVCVTLTKMAMGSSRLPNCATCYLHSGRSWVTMR